MELFRNILLAYRFKMAVSIVMMTWEHSVPYLQLTLCAKWTYNVDNDRIYKEYRNLRIRKHITTSCSGTKPFY